MCESDHGRDSTGKDRIAGSLSVMELNMGLYLESTEKLEIREYPKQFLKPGAKALFMLVPRFLRSRLGRK